MRFLIFVLLVFCLILMALHVPAVQKPLIQAHLQQLENVCGFKIHLQGHYWKIGSGLRLTGIKVYTGGREFLTCEDARVAGGASLRWPFIRLHEIHLIRPVMHLEKGHDRKFRPPMNVSCDQGAKSPSSFPKEDLPWVNLLRIRIESGQIIAEQSGQEILSVKDVTGVIILRINPRNNGSGLILDFESGGPFSR